MVEKGGHDRLWIVDSSWQEPAATYSASYVTRLVRIGDKFLARRDEKRPKTRVSRVSHERVALGRKWPVRQSGTSPIS